MLEESATGTSTSDGGPGAAEIRLLATDLDGTLIGSANELPLYTQFNKAIGDLREQFGAVWVACTGRSFRSFWEFFLPMRRIGILPEYVVIRHAYIYRLTPIGFVPHLVWNATTLVHLWSERFSVRRQIGSWHQAITGGSLGVMTIRKDPSRLTVRFDTPESAQVAGDVLRDMTADHVHIKVGVEAKDVDVRFVPATKGLALQELARHLGISRAHILTIGNGHNDLSMLNGRVAALTGCPSNSEQEVVLTVKENKGHIAAQRCLAGVLEVLDAYATSRVRSIPPPGWKAVPSSGGSGLGRGRHRHHDSRSRKRRKHLWLMLAIVYAGLLVFATFDIIPFGHIITKPVDLIIQGIVRLVSLFA